MWMDASALGLHATTRFIFVFNCTDVLPYEFAILPDFVALSDEFGFAKHAHNCYTLNVQRS